MVHRNLIAHFVYLPIHIDSSVVQLEQIDSFLFLLKQGVKNNFLDLLIGFAIHAGALVGIGSLMLLGTKQLGLHLVHGSHSELRPVKTRIGHTVHVE